MESIQKKIIDILDSLPKVNIVGKPGQWVFLAKFGKALKDNDIDFRNYGYYKLAEFVENVSFLEVFTDMSFDSPVKYVRYSRDIAIQDETTKLMSRNKVKSRIDDEDTLKVKRFLRLKNNYFIGQFLPDYATGDYKIVDIRNTDFTKIEDSERNIRNLEICFNPQGKTFRKFSYYKFTWRLINSDPLQFGIDLTQDVVLQNPEDIIGCIAHCLENYSMDAARKITRNLDTLSKQLTQSGKEVFIYELLQNANDYPQKRKEGEVFSSIPVDVEFRILDDYLTFQHTGDYFNAKNVAAICNINDGEKNSNLEAIGYKGIGFKTVFLDNDYVFLQTGSFSFRFDRKSGTSIDVPANTPWQIYPFWTPINAVSDSIVSVFEQHPNDQYRVKFALKPRNSQILTDRGRKDNYIDLFTNVFETERVILFIPNIHQVSIYFGNTSSPAIVRSKDNDSWCVSEALTDDIPEAIRERINDVLTNNDADKSDGYDKIPEKYLNFYKTAVRFACKREGRKLLPVENANLFCYLPAKRANWGFDFLMNTDMVPNGARDDIEDIELNHEIAKIAGRQFFYWIKTLIGSGEYDLDSIFSLIPDFDDCKKRHEDYSTFIDEFKEEFENLIKTVDFIPVVNSNHEDSLSTVDNIIEDITGITKEAIMSDKDFLSIMELEDYYLPILELRKSEAFLRFLDRYSTYDLMVDYDDVKRKCSNDDFVAWLKDNNNNNAFINHLLNNDKLEAFAGEDIFIEYEGDLFSSNALYYDFDTNCSSIPFLRRFIPHLAKTTRDFFEDNERWDLFVGNHFMEFDADAMLNEYILNNEEAVELLKDIDNSICFFKFVAEYDIDLSDRTGKFPYLNENDEISTEFKGLLYFYSKEIFDISQAKWLGNNSITILSHKYLENDKDNEIKEVFESLGFGDFVEKDFVVDQLVKDTDFQSKVNESITDDFETSVSFLKYVYNVRECLKEKEGMLRRYVLRCKDKDNNDTYLCDDNIRYFYQESYAENTTFADNTGHSWLTSGMMYYLDNAYFEKFPQEDAKQIESFLRQSFGIKTFTNKSFFSEVVLANKKAIYEDVKNDVEHLREFIEYLKRDEKDIFDGSLAPNTFQDMPLLGNDNSVIINRKTIGRLVELSDEAISLANKSWCPQGVFSIVDKIYSEFNKNTLQLLKIEEFDIVQTLNEITGNKTYVSAVRTCDRNIDFWRYIKSHAKSFESLDDFKKTPFLSENDDNTFYLGASLYIPDIYQKDGIESLVKKYDSSALFVSHKYLDDDSENGRQEWCRLFKKMELKSDNKDMLFKSVIPNLSEIEDDGVLAMMTKHLKDLKTGWDLYKTKLQKLKVRTRGGEYLPLNKAIVVDIKEDNIVEPFKMITLRSEVAPELLESNAEIIKLIASEFLRNCVYSTKQDWAQAKLNEYIESIQPDETKRENIHVDFIRELAALISNDFKFSDESIKKLLYKARNKDDGYRMASQLTFGSVYKPICDFEVNGITELCYLSEDYITENNRDTIRAFFKSVGIHTSFEAQDIPFLEDRAFALYFWGKYFTHRTAEFEEWIEKGKFKNTVCVPTEGRVAAPEELYSPEIFHFARNTQDWQGKVPSKAVVDSIKEEEARRIFLSLQFKKKLDFEDCLNYLLLAKDFPANETKNREQIVNWLLQEDSPDEKLILWYREQPTATWRNGKGRFAHINSLYAIHPEARQERNIFFGDEHVMQTGMFPYNNDDFVAVCDLLKVKCLRSDDFETKPINPKDETIDVIKAIMPKLLILAAIERPEKYQTRYEKYATEIKNFRFYVCDKIDLGYEEIHNDIERIYSDESHVYYVDSWLHKRTYTKFCSKLKSLLGIDVYTDVCEDVLDTATSVENCIEKYCSSFVYDETFRNHLKELDHAVSDFEDEYYPEDSDDEYYAETVTAIEEQDDAEDNTTPVTNEGSNPTSQHNQDEEEVTAKETVSDEPTIDAISDTTMPSTPISTVPQEEVPKEEESDENKSTHDDSLSDNEKLTADTKTNQNEINSESKDSSHEHIPGEVEGHHRDGCWVNEYWKEDGTYVSGHWRSDTEVSPHTREVGTSSEAQKDNTAASHHTPITQSTNIKANTPHPSNTNYTEDEEEFLGDVDKDSNFDNLGQRPRRPRARKMAKPFTQEELERMRSHGTPFELESLPATQEEINILEQCGIKPEQIADTNYLAQLRLYNNLKNELGEEPEESMEAFIRNADDVSTHALRGGRYIHACSAARGVMYVSPSVWNKMVDDKWVICVYLNGQGSKFKYINSREEFLELVEKDDVVIKITGSEKVKVVNELYSDLLHGVKGTAYTLVRVAARTNMDAVFAHYVGAMAEKDDGYDYSADLG